jgi:hypothetical protein
LYVPFAEVLAFLNGYTSIRHCNLFFSRLMLNVTYKTVTGII